MRKTMALALAGALILSLGTAGLAQAVNSHQSVARQARAEQGGQRRQAEVRRKADRRHEGRARLLPIHRSRPARP